MVSGWARLIGTAVSWSSDFCFTKLLPYTVNLLHVWIDNTGWKLLDVKPL